MPKILEDARIRLISVARKQALTNGYPGMTIRSVAQECGYSVGTVYNYFRSKEQLLAEVMLEDWQQEVGFRVVAISTDDVRHIAKAKALTRGHMWDSFTLIFDPNSALKRAMNVVDTPQVFIIDKDGKIVYSHTGYTPGSEKELLKVLKTLK